jgi:hypothetical protein
VEIDPDIMLSEDDDDDDYPSVSSSMADSLVPLVDAAAVTQSSFVAGRVCIGRF